VEARPSGPDWARPRKKSTEVVPIGQERFRNSVFVPTGSGEIASGSSYILCIGIIIGMFIKLRARAKAEIINNKAR